MRSSPAPTPRSTKQKEHGGDQARVYAAQASGALTSLQRIHTALAEDRFVLYGQPIIDLHTGQVTHNELLIRMLSEHGEIIAPALFIPTASDTDRQVVTAIVAIAHSLDKLTIAEGVENADTLDLLKVLGVDQAQGYHLARPTRLSPPTALEVRLSGG
jgi:EAL domain-containing protein (putative c-di-GMP-specific phosphodiesterase class I)